MLCRGGALGVPGHRALWWAVPRSGGARPSAGTRAWRSGECAVSAAPRLSARRKGDKTSRGGFARERRPDLPLTLEGGGLFSAAEGVEATVATTPDEGEESLDQVTGVTHAKTAQEPWSQAVRPGSGAGLSGYCDASGAIDCATDANRVALPRMA